MLNLIPTPKKSTIINNLYHKIMACIYSENNEWKTYVKTFCDMFETIFSIHLSYEKGSIELYEDKSLQKGCYRIISDDCVRLYASDCESVLYALSSLMQLVSVNNDVITVQSFSIEDCPDKEYRAFMIDLSRNWHPFDKLLKFVDICFLYKLKYLHLHFVDTGVYSLPSRAFPKLPSQNKHYTFEQIEYLNKYAKNKGIVLIPEYECPGHSPRLIKQYPEIFDDTLEQNIQGEYCNEMGEISEDKTIICAGSEKAWEATKLILKEICDMFPDSPYINIGGDEADIKYWKHCSICCEYMNKNNLADEYELYSEYIGRVTSYIIRLGKTPIVWEGFPQKGSEKIPKETIVIAWESLYNTADSLLAAGFKIINASWQPLYIVPNIKIRWGTSDILKWNVYNWQNWWEKSYAYLNPITVSPTEQVLGGMLCAWEQTYDQEIQFVLENLSAMSERVWNVKRVCSESDFIDKQRNLLRIAALAISDK